MTLFTITGDPTQYRYPEANEDVLLGQYLEYLERIAPKEPPEVAQLRAAYAKLSAMQEDVFPWMNKAGVPRDADAFDIAEGLANYLAGPEATKKAKTLLPPLLLEWNKAHDEAEAALDSMDRVWYASKMLPYIAEVVAHFTGVPINRITSQTGPGTMNVKTLEFLYGKISRAIEPKEEYTYKSTYIVDGNAYELPEKHMTNATVIEFAEAAQFQVSNERLQNGHILSLIDVCSVLLRRPGEAYSDEVYNRNRETFKCLTLAQGMEIAFFLTKRNVTFAADFLTSTALLAVQNLPGVQRN
jgi:hypothetical protein